MIALAQKDLAPAERTSEQLMETIKKDLQWLGVSLVVAVAAALLVNMLI